MLSKKVQVVSVYTVRLSHRLQKLRDIAGVDDLHVVQTRIVHRVHQRGGLGQYSGTAPIQHIPDKLGAEIISFPAPRDPKIAEQRAEQIVSIDARDPFHIRQPPFDHSIYVILYGQGKQGALCFRMGTEKSGCKRFLDKSGRQRTGDVLSAKAVEKCIGQREGKGGVCVMRVNRRTMRDMIVLERVNNM